MSGTVFCKPDPRNNFAGCQACEEGTCPGRNVIPHPFRGNTPPYPSDILTCCPGCGAEWADGDHEDYAFACGTFYNTEGSGYQQMCAALAALAASKDAEESP